MKKYSFFQKWISITLLIILISTPISSQEWPRQITPELQIQIENFIEEVMLPQGQVQGVGLGILQNNSEVLYTTAYGLADIANGVPNTNNTQFGLGSISKGFTGLVALRTLQEQFPDLGEAILDTSIFKLVPELNLTFRDRYRTEHVTVRDLLAHRVCLVGDFFSSRAEAIPTIDEVVYRIRYLDQVCDFRSVAVYGNHMITAAGYLASFVANKTFNELSRKMLDDLGMDNSSFVLSTDTASMNGRRALPYYSWAEELHLYNPEMLKKIIPHNPAGGLFSTPNDMMRYLNFLLNRGALNGQQIVPAEVIDWIFKPAVLWGGPGYKNNDEDKPFFEYGYSIGWGQGVYDGYEVIEHGGGFMTYASQASIWPSANIVIYSGSHESPDRFWKFAFHIFVFELLKGNSKAKEVALEAASKMKKSEMAKFADDNPFKSSELPNKILKNLKASWKESGERKYAGAVPGLYGSGLSGDLEILERFNENLNSTQFYLHWGVWYQGWLTEDPRYPGDLYEVQMETDALQDFPAYGLPADLKAYVGFHPDTEIPTVSVIVANEALDWVIGVATFVYGATLDNLPEIPWEPGTC